MTKLLKNNRGLTLIELVVTVVILSILASIIVPSAQMTARRTKEIELRQSLRTIRTAIDDYKRAYDKAIAEGKMQTSLNETGYPKTLHELVEGKDFGGLYNYNRKFLRRIPIDPFHPVKDPNDDQNPPWGLRSYTDKEDSTNWGGEDVFDVYSLSEEAGIDGTKYKDW